MPCCLPNCTSGYKTNLDKVHIFQVPSDPERKQTWLQTIQSVFPDFNFKSKRNFLCSKHFSADDILTKKKIIGAEDVNYLRAKLASTAVPLVDLIRHPELSTNKTKYDNIHHAKENQFALAMPKKERLISIESEQAQSDVESKKPNVNFDAKNRQMCLKESSVQTDPVGFEDFSNKDDTQSVARLDLPFSLLDKRKIKLPLHWVQTEMKSKGLSVLSFLLPEVRMVDGKPSTVLLKEIYVTQDLDYHIKCLGRSLDPSGIGLTLTKVSSASDIDEIIKLVNSCSICIGHNLKTNFECSVAYEDNFGTYRHTKCPILKVDAKKFCYHCNNLRRSINKKRKAATEGDVDLKKLNELIKLYRLRK